MPAEDYMKVAIEQAYHSMRKNLGGPFGAVVVRDGRIIGKGGNQVISTNDPTAHAEIVAIREACRETGSFDLKGAVLYSTCEPCPMCFSAIYWANIGQVYYVLSRYDAAGIGFRDSHIYDELPLTHTERSIPFTRIHSGQAEELFSEWQAKSDKTPY